MSRVPPETSSGLVEAIAVLTATSDRSTALQCLVDHACRLTGVPHGVVLVVDVHGRPSEMFHHGDDVDGLTTAASGTPISVGGQTLGLLYLSDRADGATPDAEKAAVVRALVGVAGYVLEHARSQAAAERRRVWQNHAAALGSTLRPPFDFANADRTVTDVALRAGGAVASTMARIVDGELVVTAGSGSVPAWTAGEQHEAAVHAVLEGTEAEATAGEQHAVLLAPMNTHLSPPGALALYFPVGTPPDDVELHLLGEFAEQAALALDRARAFQEREQMALVTDRDRIARELHDVVIQRLFAAGLHLQKSRALATDPVLQERLSQSMQDLDHTIRAIRGSIFDLQRRARSSLRSELHTVLDDFVEQLGFVPAVRTEGSIDEAVDAQAQQMLIEALRQALFDVGRHGGASSATVLLRVTDRELVLEVHDDGAELEPGHREAGLATLRRTLEARGGSLEVADSETGGTTLRCRVALG